MATQAAPAPDDSAATESRWPPGLALGVFVAITITLRILEPHRQSVGPSWVVPGIEIALLTVLLAAAPTRVSKRVRWVRRLAIVLVVSAVVLALISTSILIT